MTVIRCNHKTVRLLTIWVSGLMVIMVSLRRMIRRGMKSYEIRSLMMTGLLTRRWTAVLRRPKTYMYNPFLINRWYWLLSGHCIFIQELGRKLRKNCSFYNPSLLQFGHMTRNLTSKHYIYMLCFWLFVLGTLIWVNLQISILSASKVMHDPVPLSFRTLTTLDLLSKSATV